MVTGSRGPRGEKTQNCARQQDVLRTRSSKEEIASIFSDLETEENKGRL